MRCICYFFLAWKSRWYIRYALLESAIRPAIRAPSSISGWLGSDIRPDCTFQPGVTNNITPLLLNFMRCICYFFLAWKSRWYIRYALLESAIRPAIRAPSSISGWLRSDIRPDCTFQPGVTNNITPLPVYALRRQLKMCCHYRPLVWHLTEINGSQ